MALENFRLSDDQSDDFFVTVLADDGRIRIIARICREAIDDHWRLESSNPNQLQSSSQNQRVQIVRENISWIKDIILTKYCAGEYEIFTDKLGISSNNDKIICIDTFPIIRK